MPEPPNSLVFGRNRPPDARCALDSVFCPEKQASHGFRVEVRKSGPAPKFRRTSFFAGFSAARSQPRTWLGTRQPAEVSACDTSARRTCHRLCWRKKRSKRQLRKVRFFVSDGKWILSLQFRSFSVESRLQTLACSARFRVEKVPGPFFAGFSATRQPPRTWLGTRQPAKVLACDMSARRTCHRLCHAPSGSVFDAKSAPSGNSEKFVGSLMGKVGSGRR